MIPIHNMVFNVHVVRAWILKTFHMSCYRLHNMCSIFEITPNLWKQIEIGIHLLLYLILLWGILAQLNEFVNMVCDERLTSYAQSIYKVVVFFMKSVGLDQPSYIFGPRYWIKVQQFKTNRSKYQLFSHW